MRDITIGKFRRSFKDLFWFIPVVAAIIVFVGAIVANRNNDFTELTARQVSKRIDKRIGVLKTYMKTGLEQPCDQWMNLKGLPSDMVVYRYEEDTLQSWCNQFTIVDDDISHKMLFQRFSDLKSSRISPLAEADTTIKYINLGPKWYLMTMMSDRTGHEVIGGLEIRNSLDSRSVNGMNSKLKVSDRFSIYPISFSGGAPIYVLGKPVLKIIQENLKALPLLPDSGAIWVALLLLVGGILLFLFNNKSIRNMAIAISSLTAVLGFFYFVGLDMQTTSPLFSPTIYADGPVSYSLGALVIINLWIYLSVVCIYICRKQILRKLTEKKSTRGLEISSMLGACAAALILFHTHMTFKSIIMNSNINMELYMLTNADRYTFIVYLMLLLLLLTIPLIIQMMRPIVKRLTGKSYNVFSRTARVIFSLACALYLLGVSSVLGFRKESNRVDIWANRMAIDRQLGLELQLRSVENSIAGDAIITSLLDIDKDYRVIVNRITETWFSRISQDYDVNVYVFRDSDADEVIMNYFNDRVQGGIPIADNSRFIYKRSGTGRALYTGMFVYYSQQSGITRMLLAIEPKADKENKGYSSILGNSAPGTVIIPVRYSYAKYINRNMVSYHGDYAYPTIMTAQLVKADSTGTGHYVDDKYLHFVNHISEEETIVISRPQHSFTHYVVAAAILTLMSYAGISFPRLGKRRKKEKNYYKSRISMLLMMSLLATLVVMAAISVLFVYNRNEANVKNMMINKIGTIQSLVEANCKYFSSFDDFDTQEMTGRLGDISEYTKSDITLYTTSGKVFKSTDPVIFEKMLIGSRTNHDAYRKIMYQNKRYYIHKEKFAGHSFYSMYSPIFNGNGTMIAILSSPYTDSGLEFKSEAVFHSVFIFTIFFILLILTRFMSSKVVDKMFRPLTEMGKMMNAARTDGLEYIIYDRDDEISTLVRAYNLMVHDLSESSKQAAQVERDKAWSEMARQVAHEIKNPLTPIKLQIQRIIRLKQKNDPQWQEKFDSIIPVILKSIDELADTANEFSTFAKLYSEEPVVIDIDQLAKETVSLFDDKDDITFHYMGLQGACVKGPKPQLTRVFVNLLTNAVQAIDNKQSEDRDEGKEIVHGEIILSIRNSIKDGFYDIVIEDNGPGVKDENRSKLFTPNFTTKSSGTGLGLAICKNILERCGGDIQYSKSFTLGGACFLIKYPKDKGNA